MLEDCEFRMFPAHEGEPLLSKKEIESLAAVMVGTTTPCVEVKIKKLAFEEFGAQQQSNLKAGYTYFGQFISHDIVPGTSTLNSPISRKVTPLLSLDSLYGDKSLYHFLFESDGKFKLGKSKFDVLRDEYGKAIIPESRNDENVIIVQFHSLWQRIHNKFCELVFENCPTDIKVNHGELIHREAKILTIALFHLITIEDYLRTILDEQVFNAYFSNPMDYIITARSTWEKLPLEFTHAAFRFGHSMVLNSYKLNSDSSTVILRNLLRGDNGGYLTSDQKILWSHFFGPKAQEGVNINLSIARSMGCIPVRRHIVKLNLIANHLKNIRSGFLIRNEIQEKFPSLSSDTGLNNYNSLVYSGSAIPEYLYTGEKLPLWLYVLDETKTNKPIAKKLGKIGSILIAEVIRKSILEYHKQIIPDIKYSTLREEILIRLSPYLTDIFKQGERTMDNIVVNFLEEIK
jgi:hypothetical protein